jgi:hypothetical protein
VSFAASEEVAGGQALSGSTVFPKKSYLFVPLRQL